MKDNRSISLFTRALLTIGIGPALLLNAQTTLKIGTVYECPATITLQVMSCAGPNGSDACDVQVGANGQPGRRGAMPRQQVNASLAGCHAQTPAEAAARAKLTASPSASVPQVSPAGFKVGDTVSINTAFGWMDATVVSFNGNTYRVHGQAPADVTKDYPAELRRLGPLTPYDHANGIYELADKIQVNFEGKWVDSKIQTILNMEYQVEVPGNRVAWVKPANMRLVAAAADAPVSAAPKAGQPPKPGLTSCSGKIEGRYAASNGGGNAMTIRPGKITLTIGFGGSEEAECWMGGGKIYVRPMGDTELIDLDINDDGTIETPFGEMKRKGN